VHGGRELFGTYENIYSTLLQTKWGTILICLKMAFRKKRLTYQNKEGLMKLGASKSTINTKPQFITHKGLKKREKNF